MGPFIRMALFCKSFSYDVDGAMTISGIFDQITLAPLTALPTELALKLVVGAVRGDAVIGPVHIGIQWESPDGSRTGRVNVPFQLPESVPFTFAYNVNVHVGTVGVYWLELTLHDVLLTRIPLPVVQGGVIVFPQSAAVQ